MKGRVRVNGKPWVHWEHPSGAGVTSCGVDRGRLGCSRTDEEIDCPVCLEDKRKWEARKRK